MYYPCSENKDADQLRGYREADLRLCFRPCKLLVFSRTGSFVIQIGYKKSYRWCVNIKVETVFTRIVEMWPQTPTETS